KPPSPKPPYIVYGIRTAIVVAVLAGIYGFVHRIIQPPLPHSLVVLPFKHSSGDAAQDSFAEGLTFLLTNELAQISALQVISYPSAMQYKDTRKSLREIGAETKADAVVEGEVLRSGDQVSVKVQLINADKDRQLWAQEYQQELGNLTTLASDCSREIAAKLGGKITPQELARLRKNHPRNPAAYDAYLQARSHLWLENVKDNDAAIDLLEQAIKLDPDFAVARAALARAYRNRTLMFNPNDTDALEKANYQAQKARDLDP